MDFDEEMFEEHLDEEYQDSEISEEFTQLETQVEELEKKKLIAKYDQELLDKLEMAISLLRLHVQNYQRIVIFNRRRSKQRLRRRQSTLRNFFIQSLMEMQIRFAKMLPLSIEPQVFGENNSTKDEQKFEDTTTIESSLCKETSHTRPNIVNTTTAVSKEQKFENPTNSTPEEESLMEEEEESSETLCFYKDVVSKFTNDQWLDTFHMPKDIFDLICARLKTSLLDIELPLESWIAMCIYMLATGSTFSSVAMLFNVERIYARRSLFKFISCLIKEFSEETLTMPKTKKEFDRISNGFQKASNMTPCVAGVLSLFEVPNVCACGRNRSCGGKNLKVQACLDNRLLFRKVETTTQKPTMFLRSPNEISLNWKKFSDTCIVPYFIVAPPGYPLRTWLMQKYDNPKETWEYEFNKCFGSLNIYRDVAMKRLFGRWHILNTTECIIPESKTFIVKACCILHNILEDRKEYFSLEWSKDFNPARYEYKLATAVTQFYNDSKPAIEKRNSIAKLISLTKVHKLEMELDAN
ncbi:uncharacterized protein LOC119611114 [Lucilia sericata]|uniref:uncharacterized protein LOC119611114 n=1 Tax=Lucilia sericata TaxID=13632 RepID=UPI0018A8103B|nr:uncharacterized protein LOC119611114 [Lucilia sericata]